MAKDAKIIQRGINVQGNDLSVPPGTMTDSLNIAYDRDGVAAIRPGFLQLTNGLPKRAFEDATSNYNVNANFGYYDVFSGGTALHLQGLPFALEATPVSPINTYAWQCIPMNMPHITRLVGDSVVGAGTGNQCNVGVGRMIVATSANNKLEWQSDTGARRFYGTIANDASAATDASGVQDLKFRTAFDVVATTAGGNRQYYSDETTIRSGVNGAVPVVLAGSIGTPGTTDSSTGTSVRFTSATYMASDGTTVYIVDNGNAIRAMNTSGSVTTIAGSITASGDLDGNNTAARFRSISGIAYSGGFLYVTEGAAAHRVRRISTTPPYTVAIFAGALTPTSGFTDATGTAARFNTPQGIEIVGSTFYIGDSGNNALRAMTSGAVVTTVASSTSPNVNTGFVPGASLAMPSVTVRGQFTYATDGSYPAGTYVSLECTAPNSSNDCVLWQPDTSAFFHVARCPNALPNATTGPNKLDTWGVNTYYLQDVRMTDVAGGVVMNTQEQPRIIDSWTRVNPTDAMPRMRALGVTWPEAPSTSTTGAAGFANNTAWAYRYITGLKLPNGRIALGAVSERVVQTNTTGGAVSGSITCFPSPGLPYDGQPFVQLYRTKTVANTVDPGDQMFLCNEQPITYGNGVIITDSCPDELLGAELYTNVTQYGPGSTSLAPPGFANEVASFNQSLVLADFIPIASCRVKVLGVTALVSGTSTMTFTTTGPSSSDACNTLTINFNSAATDPTIKRAQIASGGSAATNAVQTARNIVRVINRCADAFMFRAMYDENDPGSFVVYSQFPGKTRSRVAVNLATSNTDTVNQSVVTFSTNATTSFIAIALTPAQRQSNSYAYGDQSDPDSFPIVYQSKLGPTEESIVRILPISETILAVKERSIWRADSTFQFQIYDNTLVDARPNSFARLNGQWIGLFGQGFRSLSPSTPVAIGRPIDRRVTALWEPDGVVSNHTVNQNVAYAAAIDRAGTYLCNFNDTWFSYNTYGQGAWGTWDTVYGRPKMLGKYQDEFLVGFDAPNGTLWRNSQRTSQLIYLVGYRYLYFDTIVNVTITSRPTDTTIIGSVNTANTIGNGPSMIGASLFDGATIVSGDGGPANPWVLSQASSVSTGSQDFFMPIEMKAQYAPFFAQTKAMFGDVVVTVERLAAASLTCTWYGRNDTVELDAVGDTPYGQYLDGAGVSRTNEMTRVSPFNIFGIEEYAYYDVQRFATPSERVNDQQIAVAISQNRALSPLVIKSVIMDYVAEDAGKVKR